MPPSPPPPATLEALGARLSALLGDRCTRSESERERHGRGEGRREVHRPGAPMASTAITAAAVMRSRKTRDGSTVSNEVIMVGT